MIRLRQETDRLVLAVEDDGRGFAPAMGKGVGILGMEERINHLGGVFVLKSELGKGSQIHVELPLSPSPAVSLP
jgi:signal transduction histidine kinase